MILTPLASLCLDLLRILAAQSVLVGHLLSYFHPLSWLQNGAVVVFFFISGYLIAMSVTAKRRQKNYAFKQFFLERFSRIYAVFLPAILLVVFIDGLFILRQPQLYRFYEAFNLKTFIANLLMLQYWPSIPFGTGRPFWALPLLWWNYLAYGWLVLSKKKWLSLLWGIIPLYSLFYGRGQGLVLIWWLGVAVYYLFSSTVRLPKHTNQLVKYFAGYSLTLYLTHYSLGVFFRDQLVSMPQQFFWYLLVGCNLVAAALARFSERQYPRLAGYLKHRCH